MVDDFCGGLLFLKEEIDFHKKNFNNATFTLFRFKNYTTIYRRSYL